MASLLLAVIYVAFISLGLPDAMLGAAWPSMSQDLGAPLSWAGGISMVISAGTIVSALLSDRMTLRFGAGKVTAVSVGLTAAALAGFSIAPNYWVLMAFAVPYGLGAGGVDAALNNYVAIHYESKHMSWLHAMWGLGMLTGPYVMGYALGHGQGWGWGYRYISIIQIVLTALLIASLPLWKQRKATVAEHSGQSGESVPAARKPLGIRGVLRIRGAKEILMMFFCYCAAEQTAMLWASSYMVLGNGIDKTTAAMWAGFFGIGITAGRVLSGFLTMRFGGCAERIGEPCCDGLRKQIQTFVHMFDYGITFRYRRNRYAYNDAHGFTVGMSYSATPLNDGNRQALNALPHLRRNDSCMITMTARQASRNHGNNATLMFCASRPNSGGISMEPV